MRRAYKPRGRSAKDIDFGALEHSLGLLLSPVKPRSEFIQRVGSEIGKRPDPRDIVVEDEPATNWLIIAVGIVSGLFVVVMGAQAMRLLIHSLRRALPQG